jgi:hypothetical protein
VKIELAESRHRQKGDMELPAIRGRRREDALAAERFARLVDAVVPASYRLAAVLLGSETEGEDALQDAAVVAWREFATLRDEDRFEACEGSNRSLLPEGRKASADGSPAIRRITAASCRCDHLPA